MNSEADPKAVQNPSLVEAIRQHFRNESDATASTLFQELRSATFLTALMESALEIEDGRTQEGSTFSVALIRDEEGQTLLPIFSDWVHLNESAPGKQGLVMSAQWAFSMAIQHYDGVIVNHTAMALPIYKGLLTKLVGEEEE